MFKRRQQPGPPDFLAIAPPYHTTDVACAILRKRETHTIWERRVLMRAYTDPSGQVIEKAAEGSIAGKAKRHAVWPVLIIALGLFASLAWSGLLGWVVYRPSPYCKARGRLAAFKRAVAFACGSCRGRIVDRRHFKPS